MTTSTVWGCSTKRSGIFSSPRRTSSRLISLATASTGTVGKRWCTVRSTRERTVPSPMPASKRRSAGGVGRSRVNSSAQRARDDGLLVACVDEGQVLLAVVVETKRGRLGRPGRPRGLRRRLVARLTQRRSRRGRAGRRPPCAVARRPPAPGDTCRRPAAPARPARRAHAPPAASRSGRARSRP